MDPAHRARELRVRRLLREQVPPPAPPPARQRAHGRARQHCGRRQARQQAVPPLEAAAGGRCARRARRRALNSWRVCTRALRQPWQARHSCSWWSGTGDAHWRTGRGHAHLGCDAAALPPGIALTPTMAAPCQTCAALGGLGALLHASAQATWGTLWAWACAGAVGSCGFALGCGGARAPAPASATCPFAAVSSSAAWSLTPISCGARTPPGLAGMARSPTVCCAMRLSGHGARVNSLLFSAIRDAQGRPPPLHCVRAVRHHEGRAQVRVTPQAPACCQRCPGQGSSALHSPGS